MGEWLGGVTMNLDTTQQKIAAMDALDNLSVFLSNSKAHMEPTKLAELILDHEALTEKVRLLFQEEKNLDSVLEKLANEVTNQAELILKQTRLLEATEAELEERTPDDEYKGVIAHV